MFVRASKFLIAFDLEGSGLCPFASLICQKQFILYLNNWHFSSLCQKPYSSMLMGSTTAKRTLRLGLNRETVFSFNWKHGFTFIHFPTPSENTGRKSFLSVLNTFSRHNCFIGGAIHFFRERIYRHIPQTEQFHQVCTQ